MGEPKRILAVDDEPNNLVVLKALVTSFGHECELARNAFEALERLTTNIDMILMDVMMPGMDGFEAARRIRAHPDYGHIPIIMVTSLTTKEDRLRAVEAGANDFISKPIDGLELRVRMASLLTMKEAQDAIKRHRLELEITVRKRTEALRESQERLRELYEESKRREELYHSFLNSSVDAIVIYDIEGRAKYVSPSFTRIFGWARDEVEGTQIPYVPDSEQEATRRHIAEILRDGKTLSGFETKRNTKDGCLLDVSLSTSRYHDHHGNPAGISVILRDITERKQAEADLAAERARREFIRETFGSYLTEDVVTEILETPEGFKLGGEVRNLTVLVSDLRGFTRTTGSMECTDVLRMINQYLEKMTEIIMRHTGTIDEIMGDGILVFFGAPRLLPDHPRLAVACALEMQEAMKELNHVNRLMGLPQLQMGIGINTGPLVVGNIGSQKRKKYGAVGTPINVAFRVEGLAAGGEILITDAVYKKLAYDVQIGRTGDEQVKGIQAPLKVYQVTALNSPTAQRTCH